VKDTVTSGAQNAAETVTGAATKGKTALLAGGAAAAGLAATVLITQRSQRRTKVLGIPMPKRNGHHMPDVSGLMPKRGGVRKDTQKLAGKVTEAADRADKIGKRVSKVATSVKQVSETAKEASKKA
jgi:hypothetical protein